MSTRRRAPRARRAVRLAAAMMAFSCVASCGTGSLFDGGDDVERDDLTLAQATEATVAAVDVAAEKLGTVVVRSKGLNPSCSDLPDDGDPVYHTYGVAVTTSAYDRRLAIDDLAREYESQGWKRSRSGDGLAVNLDRGGYRLQIQPADVDGRISITGISPCVKDPDV